MESSIRLRKVMARTGLTVALAALAFPATALAASFTVKAHFPNHTPIANVKWWITLDVTKGKTKLSGSVKYQFLFDGSVVSTQPGKKFKHGYYRDGLTFTSPAVGQPLTLVVEVTTKYGTKDVKWAVTTQAKPTS